MHQDILKILACPKCKKNLAYKNNRYFTCKHCKLQFIVNNGVPNMLVAEAEKIK